jgi:predicted TIM-barrel fold metal-dependent hydrolase
MDTTSLVAIDTHTHAEVSCWNPFDNYGEEYDRAADKYFGSSRRPTIDETIAHYREKKIGLVMFTVDAESQLGRRRVPNEEIAEAAQKNADIMVAFGSMTRTKAAGARGAQADRRARRQGLQVPPTVQGFVPTDRMAWPIYEVINEHKLPAVFHSGHSGIGSGVVRRRVAPAEQQSDAARGRGDGLPRYADHRRAPELAVAGRGVVAGTAQAQRVDRPVGLEPEILSAAASAIRQHAAEGSHPVR